MAKSAVPSKPLVKPAKPASAAAAAGKKSEPEAKKPRLANIEFGDDDAPSKPKKDRKEKKDKKDAPKKDAPKKDKPKKEKKPAVEGAVSTPVEKPKKEPKHPRKPLTEQQRTGILKKTLVGISSGAGEDGGAGEEMSFTQVKNEVKELGAEIARRCFLFVHTRPLTPPPAATIHKGVEMLLVNGTACKRNTQKVRKAQKLRVPLVRAQDYLKACKAAGKKLPVDEFLAELED